MELKQIQYFIEVALREHVTEAAHDLHVAQSAISRQIVNLESELGVPLFIREGRNVKLTPIGRIFLEHMQHAMKVIETAQREVEEYTEPDRGTIRIGFPSSLATYMLPNVISAFRESYPHVKFQLKQGSYHQLVDAVVKGEMDMALIGPVPKHNKNIKTDILFVDEIVALLPSNHPLAENTLLKLSQLKNDSFVLFPEGFILRDIVDSACQFQGFQPKVSFEGEDIDAIKGLVSAGLGVSLIPEITLIENLPRSTVKLHIMEQQVTRTVGIITPSQRKLLPTEKNFYDFIIDFFETVRKFS
ncbi:LysR family transcriptional regulator [Lentibacillus sediminis]|uniref:LysR family transcriptional regulator n=1 Tax=Lentibacillus sediminis TaxID=1940529 RepID=UPI000C1C4FF1|nr:LysR family transcriptional regulator [Lentibacillus sediminis]